MKLANISCTYVSGFTVITPNLLGIDKYITDYKWLMRDILHKVLGNLNYLWLTFCLDPKGHGRHHIPALRWHQPREGRGEVLHGHLRHGDLARLHTLQGHSCIRLLPESLWAGCGAHQKVLISSYSSTLFRQWCSKLPEKTNGKWGEIKYLSTAKAPKCCKNRRVCRNTLALFHFAAPSFLGSSLHTCELDFYVEFDGLHVTLDSKDGSTGGNFV